MKTAGLAALVAASWLVAFSLVHAASAQEPVPAKQLFGTADQPAHLPSAPLGSYAKGCLAGAVQLPSDGPNWQGMRLSRNRHWGHPALVAFIQRFAKDARQKIGWPGLLVGDMSQPRGGPMLTGHASHQIGLDVDIWLDPAPRRRFTAEEREELSATSVIASRSEINPNIWSADHARLIKLAASYPQVGRIFVHPAIKKTLCAWAGADRAWLNKVRPIYGHNYHFHVRLKCPVGAMGCKDQAPPPPGDGCDETLAWWLSDKPYAPPDKKTPPVPPKPLLLSDLPRGCTAVLRAP
ncbi:penicillin-insensitive murein endopeptidase [Rhodoligotrophos defluvii]|uniref:penicillin-insensitive murein endopeptidase n=1 Tax=Rhodoligotrophos defluvii TaxID=2561934 RepID=UPI0010C98601|nr:penicillin-insensitive murein endopeptidase [Rhodoligotrophos defluvii]